MTDVAVKKHLRKITEKSIAIYEEESYNVSIARGKLTQIADLTCFDKGIFKIIKNCDQYISQTELDALLNFNDSQINYNTILEICFWRKYATRPFRRMKLFYNQPNQKIQPELQELIK